MTPEINWEFSNYRLALDAVKFQSFRVGERGRFMGDNKVLPGISVNSAGEATISKEMGDVLFDLALELEEPAGFPVDVEHVLAAIVLAVRCGDLDGGRSIDGASPPLVKKLLPHVKTVFRDFGGVVGEEG
ncbi:hypothetical protein N9V88_02320 [bacterium]|jgi:hypothetical protein|nr:hypothetical protein [Mariniblastus sp.]MDB2318405.1 hypothetical protein [bacterium]